MDLDEFIRAFADELQEPASRLRGDTALNSIARYDSMGRLAIMSMVDSQLNVVLDADEMNRCQTLAELHALVTRPPRT